MISCFSSSIPRIQQILDLAHQHGRKVAFLGRSMNNTTEIAHDLGFLKIPNGLLLRPQDIMQTAPRKLSSWFRAPKASRCRHSRAWRWTITNR